MPATQRPNRSTGGFTALPRDVIDGLLTLPLTRRETAVLLLVTRLTCGCRNARWAQVAQSDLAAVNIGANHAGEVLRSLLKRGLLERNGQKREYRLGKECWSAHNAEPSRLRQLGLLVARQLRSSQNGNSAPKMGGQTFPKREVSPSRNGNGSTVVAWDFVRSQGKFIEQVRAAIDKERQ